MLFGYLKLWEGLKSLVLWMSMVKKSEACCSTEGFCFCKALMAVVIIVFVWVSSETWSKVVITIAAALVLLGAGGCACNAPKGVKKKKK